MQELLAPVADDEVPTAPLIEAIRRCAPHIAESRAVRELQLTSFYSPEGRRLSGAIVFVVWRAGHDLATAGIDLRALRARLAPYTDLPIDRSGQVPADCLDHIRCGARILTAWGIEPWDSRVEGGLYHEESRDRSRPVWDRRYGW